VCPRRVADRSTEAHALRKVLKTSRNGKGKKIPNGLCSMCWVTLPRDAPAGWCVGGPCKFSRARRLENRIQHTRSYYYYYYYYYRLSRQPPVGGRLESQSLRVSSATHSRLVSGQSFSLSFSVSLFYCVSAVIILSLVLRVNDN